MPCHYEMTKKEIEQAKIDLVLNSKAYRDALYKLNELTILLCSACKFITGENISNEEREELKLWYSEHKKQDANF